MRSYKWKRLAIECRVEQVESVIIPLLCDRFVSPSPCSQAYKQTNREEIKGDFVQAVFVNIIVNHRSLNNKESKFGTKEFIRFQEQVTTGSSLVDISSIHWIIIIGRYN